MTRRALAVLLVLPLFVPGCAKRAPDARSPGSSDAATAIGSAPAMATEERAAPADGGAAMRIADDEAERDDGFDPSVQAGTLTAGTFDDTRNPEVFRAFAARMRDSELGDVAARLDAPITVLKVIDADGRPVSGARVIAGRTLPSRSDGRVVLTGLDLAQNDGDTIAVTVEHQGRRHRARVTRGDASATIRLPFRAASGAPNALDIALVIDATGSMGDELEYLKVEIRSIAQAIDKAFPQVDQRFALVVYRDDGDEYVTRSFDFTADLATFERKLGRQRADGGGDYPEAMDAALVDAASLSWREGDVARMAFLVADAPPHTQNAMAALGAADELRSMGVATYPVAASGVAAEAELVMRGAALMSGGQYLFLTDDSGVGLAHEEPHIPCYSVEHLRDAMTRMIRTELSGERVEADARRTIRTVGQGRGGVCETSQSRPLAVAG